MMDVVTRKATEEIQCGNDNVYKGKNRGIRRDWRQK